MRQPRTFGRITNISSMMRPYMLQLPVMAMVARMR